MHQQKRRLFRAPPALDAPYPPTGAPGPVYRGARLVAVSAATFFRLRTGLARALWPLIDGRSQFWFLHESTIAALAGEDPACMGWRAWQRFRERTEAAFHDMQQAGGLTTWSREEHGRIGQRALRRYVFTRPRLERPGRRPQSVPPSRRPGRARQGRTSAPT